MAINFTGANYFYVIDDAVTHSPTTAVTHMCWVNIPRLPTGADQGAFAFYGHSETASNGYGWENGVLPTGFIVCETSTNIGSVDPQSASAISINTWHHIAASWDSGSQTTKIYIDGSLSSSTSVPGATLLSATSGPFTIAVDLNVGISNPQQRLVGNLEDIRVYSRLLGLSEITTIWASRGHDNIVDSLIIRYRMDELSSGSNATPAGLQDSSTSNLVLSNMVGTPTYTAGQLSFTRVPF